MQLHRDSGIWLVAVLLAFSAGAVEGADAPKAAGKTLPSSSPELEAAAAALAQGRFDAAQEGFERVAKDRSLPPLVHRLAWLGVAETAWARKDTAGAMRIWRQIAADASLPQAHRDAARRRIAEAERVQRGLPGRDPAAYREQLPTLPEPSAVFHVAPGGSDAADGSAARPFRTLEKARDAVRALKRSQGGKLPKGGVRVIMHGGEYPVKRTLHLTAQDSGTAESPVVYQAQQGTAPVFSGGVRIPGWKPISDARLREKLDPSVRGRVVEADLKALGVEDFGDATALRRSPELFCGGVPQTLARWPNEGFVKTGEVLGKDTFKVWGSIPGCKDGKFRYEGDRPQRWTDEPDARLYGYWFWDWFEEFQKVASIDPASHTLTLAPPYAQYGYRNGQRYFGVNLFCELDRPGEWYLDRRSGMVYWLPPEGFDPSKMPTTLSVLAEPFVTMENVEHVILLGLTFQEGRGDCVHIRGGADCLVAGCTLRQLGGDAIVVEGGRHHGVFGCVLHTLGCGGVRVKGGDRKTLTPGRHFVENCTVSNISRLKRTYTPAVLLEGCGNRAAHNCFENIPSSALRIEGNDQLVELNVIRNVVQESDDQGGLDIFGNPLYRGVVIRWNRWSDIRGGTHCGAAGVRLDDMISGVAIYGNIFERCGALLFGGVQIHGGKDNLVDGNLFLDCPAGISFSRWGEKRWLEGIRRFLPEASAPLYLARYPDLARIKTDADVNLVSRNIFVRCKDLFLRDGGVERTALNATIDRPAAATHLPDEKAVRSDPQLRRALFEPIPIGEIGTYPHPWSASPDSSASSPRWSIEKAWRWYKKRPWLVGTNYLPSTACNTTEFWKAESFDAPTIERELAIAQATGFNTVRVLVQYLVWKHDPEGLKKRLARFLEIAARHGISVVPTLFDDCSFGDPPIRQPYLGKQRDPIPGMIAPSWTPSPGLDTVADRKAWPGLARYVKDVVGSFGNDPRIAFWDLYNEPGNSGMGAKSLPLVEATFAWAREVEPSQPLTMGVWSEGMREINDAILAQSDIITYHAYTNYEGQRRAIARYKSQHRPVVCTEWMARWLGSRWDTDLPLFKREAVGCCNWGLVNGRMQCQFGWGSKRGSPEPKVWFHDLYHKDGRPYDPKEIEAIRKTTADKRLDFTAGSETPPRTARAASPFLDVTLSLVRPAIVSLSVDSLGHGKFRAGPLRRPVAPSVAYNSRRIGGEGLQVEYRRRGTGLTTPAGWSIAVAQREIRFISRWSEAEKPEPVVLQFDPHRCHATLLGILNPDSSVRLPALLHLPDQGSFRLTSQGAKRPVLGYDARRAGEGYVRITFPPATSAEPRIEYRWEVVAIYPKLAGIEGDRRFDGFRRNWLNIFQINPRLRVLANHAASDTCAFCLYEYADIARHTPPLAENLTALDLVRQSLDRYLEGLAGYGLPGNVGFDLGGKPSQDPPYLDSYPSLLIAAADYVDGSGDLAWLKTSYGGLRAWAEKLLAMDRDGNGLLEYPYSGNSHSWSGKSEKRPSNWWDCIGFGHEDAYANALAYRAFRGMAMLAERLNKTDDAQRYRAAAERLRRSFFDAFYNPKTGVLAGWRSADGKLHDYYFLFVSGIAIHYGLVPQDKAEAIMDRLLAKLQEVGYRRFDLGLPGNLVPVARKDYVALDRRWGGGKREDNRDGFQIYENGGATGCFAYFTLAALYDLGRRETADRMLMPMLQAFEDGGFQGQGANGMSNDWKAWDGTPWGYEGFLVDNYYALLSVLAREHALAKAGAWR